MAGSDGGWVAAARAAAARPGKWEAAGRAAAAGTDSWLWTQASRMTPEEQRLFNALPPRDQDWYRAILRGPGGYTAFSKALNDNFSAMLNSPMPGPSTPPPPPPGRTGGAAPAPAPAPAQAAAPAKPISGIGGEVVVFMGRKAIVFTVAPGVKIRFFEDPNAPLPGGRAITTLAEAQALDREAINGGNTLELTGIGADFGSFQRFFDTFLDRLFVPGDPARNDPGILRIAAEMAGRPNMSEAEIQNKIRTTEYWKQKTDKQRQWNDLSPAEQKSRIDAEAAELGQQYFELTGISKPPGDPEVAELARQVASGERSRSAVVAQHIKPVAERNPESPWSRTLRTEQENQRKRPFDIENKQAEVRAMANRWGVRLDEGTVKSWATGIVTMTKSEDDLVQYFKQTSKVLYPWKDPEMETAAAAEPWLQTYARVMERQADLFNPAVQRALQQGLPAFEFEQQLKASPDWERTRNFQEEATRVLGDIGARMGFQ